ncbi:allantoicase-like [Mytilus trossulus]|uniref:allantoicase-like n=1 Tax=Mytilus trossulus TaxID=6551 RepID=UPI0030075328
MADPPSSQLQDFPQFTDLNNLVAEQTGAKVVFATDDWFAVTENLLKADEPVFKVGVFTEYGKWMDGWETRRKRIPGHDWCIIQLGVPGVIVGVDIDTSFFTGNYTPKASIQAACLENLPSLPDRKGKMGTAATESQLKLMNRLGSQNWDEILPSTALKPGYKTSCHNFFDIKYNKRITHIRLNMFPDGGIARLRVYGRASPDWKKISYQQMVDLAAMENGGICVGYSDVHFGHARNLIQPGRAETMADGWETARKPGRPAILEADSQGILQVPGQDWSMFRLGHPGVITKIEIDTNHFKGNYPDSCTIEACYVNDDKENEIKQIFNGHPWKTLLAPKKLKAHHRQFFSGKDLNNCGVISHVRLSMAPDGGISRMRLWGYKQSNRQAKL